MVKNDVLRETIPYDPASLDLLYTPVLGLVSQPFFNLFGEGFCTHSDTLRPLAISIEFALTAVTS